MTHTPAVSRTARLYPPRLLCRPAEALLTRKEFLEDTLHSPVSGRGGCHPGDNQTRDTDSKADAGNEVQCAKWLQTALSQYCHNEWILLPPKQTALFSSSHIPNALGFEI